MASLHGVNQPSTKERRERMSILQERRREYEEEREGLQPFRHQRSRDSGHNSDCEVK